MSNPEVEDVEVDESDEDELCDECHTRPRVPGCACCEVCGSANDERNEGEDDLDVFKD